MKAIVGAIGGILLAAGAGAAPIGVGFETTQIADAGGERLAVGIWYPSASDPAPARLGPYRQTVAAAAPVSGRGLPLVVMSHGSGGWFGGHFDTAVALAQAGFVVAALTHAGDSVDDRSKAAEIWRRPPQLHRLTDFMLGGWHDRDRIDTTRIGAFGFSAGGFTALVAVGGVPDLHRTLAHCEAHPDTETCAHLQAAGPDLRATALALPPSAWGHDARIKAAVVAAPALGFAFGREGLRDVRVPVQLWRAEYDRVLPAPDFADAVRRDLPRRPDFRLVRNADHYDFLPPCPPALAADVPAICGQRAGFDRARFHARFNQAVVAFFRRRLDVRRP